MNAKNIILVLALMGKNGEDLDLAPRYYCQVQGWCFRAIHKRFGEERGGPDPEWMKVRYAPIKSPCTALWNN
jgi:hypothetical protein